MSERLTIEFLTEWLEYNALDGLPRINDNAFAEFAVDFATQLIATMQREAALEDGETHFRVAYERVTKREAKHVAALKLAKALTKKYLSRINFDGLDDREITELREIHYQMEDALKEHPSDYTNTAETAESSAGGPSR